MENFGRLIVGNKATLSATVEFEHRDWRVCVLTSYYQTVMSSNTADKILHNTDISVTFPLLIFVAQRFPYMGMLSTISSQAST
jgi:hypothetical protein